jgi:hypothetical protein
VERETQIDEDWIYDVEEIALESEKESDSDWYLISWTTWLVLAP